MVVAASLNIETNSENEPTIPHPIPFSASPPININGNVQLALASSSGSGIIGDPFIIENKIIDALAYSGDAISIVNTDAYFILRNCTIFDTMGSYFAIKLNYVTHATIQNNTIYNTYGISIQNSNSVTIDNNYLYENLYYTIYVVDSPNTIISSNYIKDNNYYGMLTSTTYSIIRDNIIVGRHERGIQVTSDNNLIENNTISGVKAGSIFGGEGIYVYSDYNRVIGNNISYCQGGTSTYSGIGIRLNTAFFNYIENNSVLYTSSGSNTYSGNGIILSASDNNTFTRNTVWNSTGLKANSGYGILLINSESNNFNWTYLKENEKEGIYLDLNSHYNTIVMNGFQNNNDSGIQAADNGNANIWYLNNRGNYWSDFLDVTPSATPLNNIYYSDYYPIGGSSGKRDYYGLIGYYHGYRQEFPIIISSDANFLTWKSQGDGTTANPYIIENIAIDYSGYSQHGLRISSTTKNFILRNIKIIDGQLGFGGICLEYLSTGTVENCILSNPGIGLISRYSENLIISNNFVENTGTFGVYIENTNQSRVESNRLVNCKYGIYLNSANFNVIQDNDISFSSYQGMNFYKSNFNQIKRNLCYNGTGNANSYSGTGFFIQLSLYNTFVENIAHDNKAGSVSYTGNGFYLLSSNYSSFIACSSHHNDGDYQFCGNGFFLMTSENNAFVDCYAYNNSGGNNILSGNGFLLNTSKNNTLSQCAGYGNFGSGGYSGNGLMLYYSANTTLSYCNAYYNKGTSTYTGSGFVIFRSNSTSVYRCTSFDNEGSGASSGNGFYSYLSYFLIIEYVNSYSNLVTNSNTYSGCGIALVTSPGVTVTSSYFANNVGSSDYSGIGIMSNSNNLKIANNTITGNDDYGIHILGQSCLIYSNYIADNIGNSAWDHGTSNVWTHPTMHTGNYWGDYLSKYPGAISVLGIYWNITYSIFGTGAGKDYYPLIPGGPTPSLPINAANDVELAKVASYGSGTALDPYVITSKYINSSSFNSDGIRITGCSKSFVIQNSVVVSTYTNRYGIFLQSVANSKVINCTLFKDWSGVYVYQCTNVNVTDCYINRTISYGIYYFLSSNSYIERNYAGNCNKYGIILVDSDYTNLIGNEVGFLLSNDINNAIYLYSCTGNALYDNLVHDIRGNSNSYSGFGYYLYSSPNLHVENNSAYNIQAGTVTYTGCGFYARQSDDITMINNLAYNTFGYVTGNYKGIGFYLYNSLRSILINNTAYENHGSTQNNQGIGFLIDMGFFGTYDGNIAFNNTASSAYGGVGFLFSNTAFCMIKNNIAYKNQGDASNSGIGFLLISTSSNTFLNNSAYNNTGTVSFSGIGFLVRESSANNNFTKNYVYNNYGQVSWSGLGFYVLNSYDNELYENQIYNNSGSGSYCGIGIAVDNGRRIFIQGNTIHDNYNLGTTYNSGIGIYSYDNIDDEISFNDIYNNSIHGIMIEDGNNFQIYDNIINCNGKAGIYLDWCVNYWVTDNQGFDNLKGIYDEGGSGYIDSNFFIDIPGITITENYDFRFFITGGIGTNSNPYIIENFQIDAEGWNRPGIIIYHTTSFFELHDCKVINTPAPYSGIYLYDVANGKVNYNNVSYNYRGICINETSDIHIEGNEVHYNEDYGFMLIDSIYIDVIYNNFLYNRYCKYIDPSTMYLVNLGNICDHFAPKWANPLTFDDPLHYTENMDIIFTIDWTDNYGLATVKFEFDGVTQIITNHVGNTYSTTIFGISGGLHQYRWWANDTAYNSTITDIFSFTVLPIEPELILMLNDEEGDLLIDSGTLVNITVLNPNELNGIVIYNGSLYLTDNLSALWLFNHIGELEISAFFSGNENYTSKIISYKLRLIIDHQAPQFINPFTLGEVPIHYSENLGIIFTINWTDNYGLDTIIFEFDGVQYTVTDSEGNTYSKTILHVSGGYHQYRWWANDTAYNTTYTDYYSFTILPIEPVFTLLLNDATGDLSIPAGSFVNITVINPLGLDSLFVFNGTNYLTNDLSDLWQFNSIGEVEIIAFFSGNENYTSKTISYTLTLTDPNYIEPDYTDLIISLIIIIALAVAVGLIGFYINSAMKKRVPPPPPLLKKRPSEAVCAWHGKKLNEDTYECTECGVKYCLECVFELLQERDTCRFCGKPIDYYRFMRVAMNGKSQIKPEIESLIKSKEAKGTLPPNYYEMMRETINNEQQRNEADLGKMTTSAPTSSGIQTQSPKAYKNGIKAKNNEGTQKESNYYANIREKVMKSQQEIQEQSEKGKNER